MQKVLIYVFWVFFPVKQSSELKQVTHFSVFCLCAQSVTLKILENSFYKELLLIFLILWAFIPPDSFVEGLVLFLIQDLAAQNFQSESDKRFAYQNLLQFL